MKGETRGVEPMSAEIFRQHRDRLCDAWVSAQAGVLALQAARARNERKSRILKWLTLIAGALTGAAGVDFLTATGAGTPADRRDRR